MSRVAAAIGAVACLTVFTAPMTGQAPAAPRWFKGNTHTHTLNSDGDSAPSDVVNWYRSHGYQFLVITDHEFVTDAAPLNALFGAENRFLMIPGQEVTGLADGGKPVHVNQIGAKRVVMPMRAGTPLDVLQKNVALVREAGALAQINHPNFGWAWAGDELVKIESGNFLEIWNGHPQVNNLGGGGVPSAEAMWDQALTAGRRIFAIADDDAHHFKIERLADPTAAAPGRGWIYVRANTLETSGILAAMERGDFYASSGVEITDIQATATGLTLKIKTDTVSRFRTEFVGAGGRVLAESATPTPTYTFKGDEKYVRARVFESNGKRAWTQPVFLQR